MHMVRHDDEITQMIARAVEVPQGFGNYLIQVGPFENTLTITSVKIAMKGFGETLEYSLRSDAASL